MPSANRRRGAAVVEMALVTPLFFVLVFGLIEFGRMVMVQDALMDAARDGCRTAVLATTISQANVETKIRNSLASTVAVAADVDKCRIAVSPSNLNGMEPGTAITTSVEMNYADVTWLPPSFLASVVLRGEATMNRE